MQRCDARTLGAALCVVLCSIALESQTLAAVSGHGGALPLCYMGFIEIR